MPWHTDSGTSPEESLIHFGLGLNEQLKSMRNIVVQHAFTDKMAHFFLAKSTQGRGGVYHLFTPHFAEFFGIRDPPPEMRPTIGLVLECKLELTEFSVRACDVFEAGLARIRSSQSSENGRWSHTRGMDIYRRVCPMTSTYAFRQQVFHIDWDITSFPPRPIIELTYPANHYFDYPTSIPLIVRPLLERLELEASGSSNREESPAFKLWTFLQGVLEGNTSKGKGRA
ncbi:hypothetical protein C8R44DRAFT_861615 [Mycena epipterygia]|nr:hypothetical protein C8R44DRAFT_861615 [Mycena epipterygia]